MFVKNITPFRHIVLCLIWNLAGLSVKAQKINTDTLTYSIPLQNIANRQLFADSLVSSFVITIKKEVKKHKHEFHSEHIYVIEGTADMLLGNKIMSIQKGDFIFIPQNMPHEVTVTSTTPLKVISIQAPYFDGKDRIALTE